MLGNLKPFELYETGTQVYKKYTEGDTVTFQNSIWIAGSNIKLGKIPSQFGSGWRKSESGDITGIGITASAGLTGTKRTVSGFHYQTITVATGGITTAHIADNAITSSKIADGAILGVDVATGVTLTNPDITGDAEIFGALHITGTAATAFDAIEMNNPVIKVTGTNRVVALDCGGGGVSAQATVSRFGSAFIMNPSGVSVIEMTSAGITTSKSISSSTTIKGNTGEFTDIISVNGLSAQAGTIKGNTGEFTNIVVTDGLSCEGISCASSIVVKSAGDVSLILNADTDNVTETDNPLISMRQDGEVVKFEMGILGANGDVATGSQANWAYMNTTFASSGIHFATDDVLRLNIHEDGEIGIGTVTPGASLDVIGSIFASDGISANSSIVSGNTGEFTDIISVNGLSAHGGLVKGKTGEFNELVAISGICCGGDVKADNLILQEDGTITVEGDTEAITLNFNGGVLDISSTAVDIKQKLRHKGDSDTYLNFTPNRIDMYAGDTLGFAYNGITFDFRETEVTRPQLKDYSETVHAVGTVTISTALDFENGNVQTVTTSALAVSNPVEYSLTNPPASGIAGTMTVIFTNGSASTSSFHSSIIWPGGVEPTLSASGVDVISFLTTDGGTTYYGFVGGLNFS